MNQFEGNLKNELSNTSKAFSKIEIKSDAQKKNRKKCFVDQAKHFFFSIFIW